MLSQLLGMPLMFFLVLLPVMLAAAWVLNASPIKAGGPLAISALFILCAALAAQIGFATLYLTSPTFTDHIEPNTAIVAWLYTQGEPIFHALDAPERYAFLYGPLAYMASGLMYQLLGASTLSAKLAGYLCMFGTMFALAGAVRRTAPSSQRFFPVIVALGYLALLALFFKNHSFWSKPDPFMMACVALGLYACTLQAGRNAWLICAVALGLAVNAKITGAVYFLPLLAWFFMRDGLRSMFFIGIVSVVLALLPFVLADNISLPNYIAWLQSAGGHGISKVLLLQNSLLLLFALLPVVFFMLWQQAVPGFRALLVQYKFVSLAAFVAALLILIAASKPGSGPHHFLPFFPCIAFLVAYATLRVYSYRPETNWSIYAFWAPACAFLIAALVKSSFALYFGIDVVLRQLNGDALVSDVVSIVEDHPGQHVYMGYGDGSRYVSTFVRHHLAFAGQPYLIDAPALMDFQLSGVEIPQATVDALLDDPSALWLIPAGQEPFSIVNWYYRNSSAKGLLFDEPFRTAFADNFRRVSSTAYFDLYAPERQAPVE